MCLKVLKRMIRYHMKQLNQNNMTALIITSFVFVAFVFYYIGKHQERIEWNKLIKDGILPKPIKK